MSGDNDLQSFALVIREEIAMKKAEEKALVMSTFTSVLLALSVAVSVVYFISAKIKQKRAYIEKWKDYDECGV